MKAALAADPLAPFSTKDQRACLGTDGRSCDNYNVKINWVPLQEQQVLFQNTWAAKSRNARNASDTRPIETTYRQKAVGKAFGTFGWDVGPSPFWKAATSTCISDRWLVDMHLVPSRQQLHPRLP